MRGEAVKSVGCTGYFNPHLNPKTRKSGLGWNLTALLDGTKTYKTWCVTTTLDPNGGKHCNTARAMNCPVLTVANSDWGRSPATDDGSGNRLCGPCHALMGEESFVGARRRSNDKWKKIAQWDAPQQKMKFMNSGKQLQAAFDVLME